MSVSPGQRKTFNEELIASKHQTHLIYFVFYTGIIYKALLNKFTLYVLRLFFPVQIFRYLLCLEVSMSLLYMALFVLVLHYTQVFHQQAKKKEITAKVFFLINM